MADGGKLHMIKVLFDPTDVDIDALVEVGIPNLFGCPHDHKDDICPLAYIVSRPE